MVWTLDGPFATADYSYRLTSDYVQFDDNALPRPSCGGARTAWPVADARADPALCKIYYRHRRRCRGDACQPEDRGLADDHAQARQRRGPEAHQRQMERQALAADPSRRPGRFQVLLSGAMQRYLIPGLGIVDVMTDLKVVPGPGRPRQPRRRHRKGLGPPSRQQFFPRPHRRPAVTDDEPRARQRRDRPFHQPAALFAQAAAVRRRRAVQGRHLPYRRERPAGEIRPAQDGARRPYRAAQSRPPPREPERSARHQGDAPAAQSHRGRFRLSRERRIEAWPVHQQRADPAAARTRRQSSRSHRSTPAARMRAATSFRPRRVHRPADARQRHTRRNARLLAGLGRAADRRASDRGQREFPGRLRRPQRAAPTAPSSSPTSGRPSRASSTRAASRSAAVTLARLTANAKLVNGSGQVRAAFAGRRGANFDFSTLARVSPDRIQLTGSGHIDRQPLVLNQAAVLTRSGDGWALAPTSLSFAGGTATVSGPQRLGARSSCAARRNAARGARHLLAQSRPLRLGVRTRRLCVEVEP